MFIPVEVVFAGDKNQLIISLSVPTTCCIEEAIQHSGLLTQCPNIDLTKNKVGIFSKILPLNTIVQTGDRVEIYCALIADPKKNRSARAKEQKTKVLESKRKTS